MGAFWLSGFGQYSAKIDKPGHRRHHRCTISNLARFGLCWFGGSSVWIPGHVVPLDGCGYVRDLRFAIHTTKPSSTTCANIFRIFARYTIMRAVESVSWGLIGLDSTTRNTDSTASMSCVPGPVFMAVFVLCRTQT